MAFEILRSTNMGTIYVIDTSLYLVTAIFDKEKPIRLKTLEALGDFTKEHNHVVRDENRPADVVAHVDYHRGIDSMLGIQDSSGPLHAHYYVRDDEVLNSFIEAIMVKRYIKPDDYKHYASMHALIDKLLSEKLGNYTFPKQT